MMPGTASAVPATTIGSRRKAPRRAVAVRERAGAETAVETMSIPSEVDGS
jgi:hypothetical protein